MLGKFNVAATIPVQDFGRARKFYEEVLGLTPGQTMGDGAMTFSSGNTEIFLYQSEFAGTNKATSATWAVDDTVGLAKALREKGVEFENYDMPGLKTEDGVVDMGGKKAAWFKDTEGNILCIGEK